MTDDTLLPDQLSFAVHDMRDITNMEVLTADHYCYWQAVMGDKQKIKHARLSVMSSWGVLDAALVVIHHDTLREMKWSVVALKAHWSFPSPPDTLRLYGQPIIGLISCSRTSA